MSRLHVTAPVTPVLSSDGVLEPPDDPATVGWWMGSAFAGGTVGTTVLVGHVDGPAGPGALYHLIDVRAGDRITVHGAQGDVVYAVDALAYHGKGAPLPASLFDPGGAPRLVIISCGGPFDRETSEYADNVVVQATPV